VLPWKEVARKAANEQVFDSPSLGTVLIGLCKAHERFLPLVRHGARPVLSNQVHFPTKKDRPRYPISHPMAQ